MPPTLTDRKAKLAKLFEAIDNPRQPDTGDKRYAQRDDKGRFTSDQVDVARPLPHLRRRGVGPWGKPGGEQPAARAASRRSVRRLLAAGPTGKTVSEIAEGFTISPRIDKRRLKLATSA